MTEAEDKNSVNTLSFQQSLLVPTFRGKKRLDHFNRLALHPQSPRDTETWNENVVCTHFVNAV